MTELNVKMIKYLFPFIHNKFLLNHLKIDDASIHYISTKEVSDKITTIISHHILLLNINFVVITDATAGVGGNAISFANTFNFLNAIEIDEVRCSYLHNNLSMYGLNNFRTFNTDFLQTIYSINNHSVIFIDPPWGGEDYKKHSLMQIHMNTLSLDYICNDLLFNQAMKKNPQFICLKLPKNYDIYSLYSNIQNVDIYLYNLNKMIIIIIQKKQFFIKLHSFTHSFVSNIISDSIKHIISIN